MFHSGLSRLEPFIADLAGIVPVFLIEETDASLADELIAALDKLRNAPPFAAP